MPLVKVCISFSRSDKVADKIPDLNAQAESGEYRAGARTLIGGGGGYIFIYSGSAD